MKTIIFKKEKFEIPQSWADVTLAMQMQVSQIASEQKYVKTLGILAGYTGISIEDLKTAKLTDLNRVMKHLAFLNDPIPEEVVMEFDFNGHHYIVPPTIIEQEFQDYVAIQTAIAEYENNKWLVTPFILAVMCKRNGDESLDDFNINERAKEFEQIPISIANGIAAFFLTNTKVSKSIMMLSSPEARTEILHAKIKELNLSLSQLRKQRGGNLLIRLWVMILRKYMKYLNKNVEKFFNLPVSKSLRTKWKTIYRR